MDCSRCRLLWFPTGCSHLPQQKAHSHVVLIQIIYFPFQKGRVSACVTRALCLVDGVWFWGAWGLLCEWKKVSAKKCLVKKGQGI